MPPSIPFPFGDEPARGCVLKISRDWLVVPPRQDQGRHRQQQRPQKSTAQLLSARELQAMPALEELVFKRHTHKTPASTLAISSKRCGAAKGLQNLQRIEWKNVPYRARDWKEILEAVAVAPCASRLWSIVVKAVHWREETMAVLSVLVAQNAFPGLGRLHLEDYPAFGDKAMAVPAAGLTADSCQTRLTVLSLVSVDMGDDGVATVGSLARAGVLDRVATLDLSANPRITTAGWCALAVALEALGLPALLEFHGRGRDSNGRGAGAALPPPDVVARVREWHRHRSPQGGAGGGRAGGQVPLPPRAQRVVTVRMCLV